MKNLLVPKYFSLSLQNLHKRYCFNSKIVTCVTKSTKTILEKSNEASQM